MIEADIKTWIETTTGIDCWQSPIRDRERPSGEHMTYRVLAIEYLDFDHVHKLLDGQQIKADIDTTARLIVDINAYGYKAHEAISSIVTSRSQSPDLGSQLSFMRASNTNNLTGIDETDYRYRWVTEVTMAYKITTRQDIYNLHTMLLTGTVAGVNSNVSIKRPLP